MYFGLKSYLSINSLNYPVFEIGLIIISTVKTRKDRLSLNQ